MPLCLVAVVAAVWAFSPHPDCDALAGDDDPAIARVDGECIRLSDYGDSLRTVEAGIEYSERELLDDDPYQYLDNLRARHELVISYGPETIALAGAIWRSALYQRAVSDGHTPTDEEVSHYRDRNRLRSEGAADFIELVKLVEKSDLAGIEELLERSTNPDFSLFKDMSLPELRASLGGLRGGSSSRDVRELEKSLQEWEAFLESVGRERYWNEIYTAELRRDLSTDMLEQAVLDASIDGPWEIPGMAWVSHQRETLSRISASLTNAAPPGANLEGALAYLAEFLEMERRFLVLEYERRRQR